MRPPGHINFTTTTSNPQAPVLPRPKPEPPCNEYTGWYGGYSFRQFLSNCYANLGEELSTLTGVHQLCHHYYLQNGILDAKTTAERIRTLLHV